MLGLIQEGPRAGMPVHVVDPSAFTPPYDHALCSALARAGADVELVTSRFAFGDVPAPEGYRVSRPFYRLAAGSEGSWLRRATKLAEHPWDMLAYRRRADAAAVVHFQWLHLAGFDGRVLPTGRPVVLTAHDAPPPASRRASRLLLRDLYGKVDAVVTHSHHGRADLVELGVDPARVHVIHHGAFTYLTRLAAERELAPELAAVREPVALFLGLVKPYKGLDVLLEAWRGIRGAELWVAGLPKMPIGPLRAGAPSGVRWITRFLPEDELPALLRRADVVVLPYRRIDQSGVLFAALAFGRPLLLTTVGGFQEVADAGAAAAVPPEDPGALRDELRRLLFDPAARDALAAGARRAAASTYSWDAAAANTLALYQRLL